ncbi:MAG: zinc ABC transporter substrate-binding protein [Ignavibacteriae bacterium]|nr:zinc ABC transporter substrate-binding protein [Ignavibacteriota bacterium]
MKKIILFSLIVLFFSLIGFHDLYSEKPHYVVTGYPVKFILEELTRDVANVTALVPPGASPHTFAPNPSDIKIVQKAKALFYVSEELDGWASKIQSRNVFRLIDLLPSNYRMNFSESHRHGNDIHEAGAEIIDPHFWTDPIAVKSLALKLTTVLINLDRANEKKYIDNSKAFMARLELLNLQIMARTVEIRGKYVFLFHPSFRYFIKRYGLQYGGAIEIDPGVEPSARHTGDILKKIKQSGAKAIFTEPQLNPGPARVIAESIGIKLAQLDPNGGVAGRNNYFDLLFYNLNVLINSLK